MKNKSSFKGTQQNLYTICLLGWEACERNLERFALFSLTYTMIFIAHAREKVAEAIAMPSKEALQAPVTTVRSVLVTINKAVLKDWRQLKRYIKKAFPKDLWQTNFEAAGLGYYTSASRKKWESTSNLIRDARNFLLANAGALTANDNMPTGFAAAFGTKADSFEAQRAVYIEEHRAYTKALDAKAKINKAIYGELMAMFDAGKTIFENEPLLARLFNYDALLNEIRGNQPSGLKGTIRNIDGNQPLADVTFTVKDHPDRTATTDATGKYELRLPAGRYTITISKPGFQSVTLTNKEIKVGVMSRMALKLVAK